LEANVDQIICLLLEGEREIPHHLWFIQLSRINPRHLHILVVDSSEDPSEVTQVARPSRPCHIHSNYEALQYESAGPDAWPV